MIYYTYFDQPSTGECMEYELLLGSNQGLTESTVEFGFCSGENSVLCFKCLNGKVYDNDNNFVYSLNSSLPESFELYGNVFESYHNYSIDRVPTNLNCSKVVGTHIDGFYTNDTGLSFGLKVYGQAEVDSLPY